MRPKANRLAGRPFAGRDISNRDRTADKWPRESHPRCVHSSSRQSPDVSGRNATDSPRCCWRTRRPATPGAIAEREEWETSSGQQTAGEMSKKAQLKHAEKHVLRRDSVERCQVRLSGWASVLKTILSKSNVPGGAKST